MCVLNRGREEFNSWTCLISERSRIEAERSANWQCTDYDTESDHLMYSVLIIFTSEIMILC